MKNILVVWYSLKVKYYYYFKKYIWFVVKICEFQCIFTVVFLNKRCKAGEEMKFTWSDLVCCDSRAAYLEFISLKCIVWKIIFIYQ